MAKVLLHTRATRDPGASLVGASALRARVDEAYGETVGDDALDTGLAAAAQSLLCRQISFALIGHVTATPRLLHALVEQEPPRAGGWRASPACRVATARADPEREEEGRWSVSHGGWSQALGGGRRERTISTTLHWILPYMYPHEL